MVSAVASAKKSECIYVSSSSSYASALPRWPYQSSRLIEWGKEEGGWPMPMLLTAAADDLQRMMLQKPAKSK